MDTSEIDRAVAVLKRGGLVAFPTETVYGLGADARNDVAIGKIFSVKKRPADHPLIVHLADVNQLKRWAREVNDCAQRLATAFWPGPLTLILKRLPNVSDKVTGGQDTVGVRVPAHPMAHALLAAFGDGIAAPSANHYGYVSATTAQHVKTEFGNSVDFVLDGGGSGVGIESTIVDVTGERPILVRRGHISAHDIEQACGVRSLVPRVYAGRASGTALVHYAPNAVLHVVAAQALTETLHQLSNEGHRVGVLARKAKPVGDHAATWIAAPRAVADYARELYASLRQLDEQGCTAIVLERLPARPEWAAVNDRIARAAAKFKQ